MAQQNSRVNPAALECEERVTKTEREFVRRAKKQGWKVLRAGWPDFMLLRRNEKGGLEFRVVEVKQDHDKDKLRDVQRLMLSALAILGIDCFIWSMDKKTLRRVERVDAFKTVNEILDSEDRERVRAGLKELRSLGVLVRYDL